MLQPALGLVDGVCLGQVLRSVLAGQAIFGGFAGQRLMGELLMAAAQGQLGAVLPARGEAIVLLPLLMEHVLQRDGLP
ncbi:MAG TPA: hypothetical protein VK457_01285 [Chloroflexota bacterium]|nr:hypothetical protein [Chloroflexota bacterium]